MLNKAVLVSVVIPTQSRTDMLREAAVSVLTQSVGDIELILVPNAATDACLAVTESIRASYQNVQVLPLAQGNLGAARNAGAAVAKGKWLSFLDDDDIWLPSKLEIQLRIADETGADMVASPAIAFNSDGIIGPVLIRPPKDLTMRQAMTVYNWLPGSASGGLIKRDALCAVGGFDARMDACADWDFWRRLAWRHSIVVPDVPLVNYRMHEGSMSRSRYRMARTEFRHLVKMTGDSPPDLRRMVARAWLTYIFRQLAQIAEFIDAHSGKRLRRVVRWFERKLKLRQKK